MMSSEQQELSSDTIRRHYIQHDIESTIRQAVSHAGLHFSQITRSDLSTLDELHIGGKAATVTLAKNTGLPPGSTILDVGSGLGGPARTLAAEFGYIVIGLDITEGFSQLSQLFSTAVNLASQTTYVCGDALALPFRSQTYDGIWSQHCSMNIANKKRLYSEYYRVLKKGGRLMIHDVVEGDDPPIHYPVPWASSPELSFLVSESEMAVQLETVGFKELSRRDITHEALSWFKAQKSDRSVRQKALFNQKMVYGDNLLTMVQTMVGNLKENRMRIVEAILTC